MFDISIKLPKMAVQFFLVVILKVYSSIVKALLKTEVKLHFIKNCTTSI